MKQFLVSYARISAKAEMSYHNELTDETAGPWLLNAKRRFEGETMGGRAISGERVILMAHVMVGYMAPRQQSELEERLR